jgi:hypothetical protein
LQVLQREGHRAQHHLRARCRQHRSALPPRHYQRPSASVFVLLYQ